MNNRRGVVAPEKRGERNLDIKTRREDGGAERSEAER